jgi:hypothetical protein
MTSPPAYAATTEPPVEHISGERVTDLSTKSGQERYLVRELGVTYPQAKALIRAYILDQRDRDARRASAEEFGNWLQSNWPSLALATFGATRRPPVDPHRWRTHS